MYPGSTCAPGPGGGAIVNPGYMSRKIESLERIISIRETIRSFDSVTHVNGWLSVVYMKYMSQSFCLFSGIEFICSKLSIFFCSCIRGHQLPGPESRDPGRARVCGRRLGSHPSSRRLSQIQAPPVRSEGPRAANRSRRDWFGTGPVL